MTDYRKLAGQTVDGWYYLLPKELCREYGFDPDEEAPNRSRLNLEDE